MCMQKAAEAMVSICRGTKKLRTKLGYKCNFKVAHINLQSDQSPN